MPLLLCFVIAAVVTEGVKDALGLGKDTAQRAWEKSWARAAASSARMRTATDRRLRAMRGHKVGRYAAFGLAGGSWAARLAGRLGGRGLLLGARATGATGRALLLGTAGAAGAMRRGARRGLAKGAMRYESYAAKRGKTPSGWAAGLVSWLKSRARTVDSTATERETTQPPASTRPPTPTGPAPEPAKARPMPGRTNPDPTTTSAPAQLADSPTVLEGDIVTTPTAAPATTGSAPDVVGHESAIANLTARKEQCQRAADIAAQIEALQAELNGIAADMASGQQNLTDSLSGMGVTAPNLEGVVTWLQAVAENASLDVMLNGHMILNETMGAIDADITDLQSRFGHAHEVVVAEGIDPAYLAG